MPRLNPWIDVPGSKNTEAYSKGDANVLLAIGLRGFISGYWCRSALAGLYGREVGKPNLGSLI